MKHIVSDPDILGGMPVIVGTRVPISRILYLLKTGESLVDIQKHFPHVSLMKLEKALEELAVSFDNSHYASKVL